MNQLTIMITNRLKLLQLLSFALIMVLISSCSTSLDVANDGWIQKRKYRQGIHVNLNTMRSAIANVTFTPAEGLESTPLNPDMLEEKDEISCEDFPTKRVFNPFDLSAIPEKILEKKQALKAELRSTEVVTQSSDEQDIIKEPESVDGRTVTSKYKRGGKIALVFAIAYGVLAFLGFWIATLGFPALSILFFLMTLISFFTALILGMKNRKMSKAARAALLVLLFTFILYSTISTGIQVIYAPSILLD